MYTKTYSVIRRLIITEYVLADYVLPQYLMNLIRPPGKVGLVHNGSTMSTLIMLTPIMSHNVNCQLPKFHILVW